MLLLASILGVGLLLGWGFGGALRNLGHVGIQWWWMYPVGLFLQVVPVSSIGEGAGRYLPFALLLLSYLVLVGVTAINWRQRGFLTILVGLVLNVIPIAVNQGMPVSGSAARQVGGSVEEIPREAGRKHHLATPSDELTFLADVIPVRDPFRTVVSIGDLLMYAGAATFLAAAMLGRPERPSRRLARPVRQAQPSTMWGSRR